MRDLSCRWVIGVIVGSLMVAGILFFGEGIDPSGLTTPNVVLLAEPIN